MFYKIKNQAKGQAKIGLMEYKQFIEKITLWTDLEAI
jgi:hypothetical protein